MVAALIGLLAPLVIVMWSAPARTATQSLVAQVRTAIRPAPTGGTSQAAQSPAISPRTAPTPKAAPRTKAPTTKPRVTKPAGSLARADNRWEMVPVRDLPPYNDAVIKNSADSARTIRVCRDWGTTSCRAGSPTGRLKPGENSGTKFTWQDTDGFNDGSGWVQQHGCFGCTVTVAAH